MTSRVSDDVAEAHIAVKLRNIFRRAQLRLGDVLNKHEFMA
jgi:hypothetical protein